MNDLPLPPPTGKPVGARTRPWWGPIDGLLAYPVIILAVSAFVLLLTPFLDSSDDLVDNVGLFVLVLVVQQLLQVAWPTIVSRRKGFSLAEDWGLRFDLPGDLRRGVGLAIACVVLAGLVTFVLEAVVSVPEGVETGNTDVLTDNDGSPWILAIVFLVVIGAPFTEEILFRGLIMRAFERGLGHIVAIGLSTLIFAVAHYDVTEPLSANVVLLGGLFTVGLLLAISTWRTGRLGPAIVAHVLFNAFGSFMTLVV